MIDPASAAYQIAGTELENGWLVLELEERDDDRSGGLCSVRYGARGPNGERGFLKAFDYSAAFDSDDPPRALQALTSTYNAERDLLALCGTRRLRRIVRVLEAGDIRVSGASPPLVSYLIFERADEDARDAVSRTDDADQLSMLRLAHHAAVAMAQLHSIRATHQDVKPSNLLVWTVDGDHNGKLGDVGQAHVEGRPCPNDDLEIPGDITYAPPELLYGARDLLPPSSRRYASDLHMLGNLICYLMTTVPYNSVFYGHLDATQHWANESFGTFESALSGLVDAHGQALARIIDATPASIQIQFGALIDALCHPDPRQRGDAVARRFGLNPFRLDRFVSLLDRLYRTLDIATRRAA